MSKWPLYSSSLAESRVSSAATAAAVGTRVKVCARETLKQVLAGGRLVEEALFADRQEVPPVGHGSVKCRPVTPASFSVKARDGETPVIGVVPGRIITERLAMALPSRDGEALPDLAQDAIKVTVIERAAKQAVTAASNRASSVNKPVIARDVMIDWRISLSGR